MSYPKNFTKNCTIYDKVLWSDLENYNILENDTEFKLNYTAPHLTNQYSNGTIQSGHIESIINAYKPDVTILLDNSLNDIWLPAIVSNDSFIKTKEVLLGNAIGTKNLGIEEIIKFTDVKFKNWNVENGSLDLCLDWIINTNLSSYEVEYGVLCWYKLNSIHTHNRQYRFSQIPSGTRIRPATALSYKLNNTSYTINTDTIIVKADNKRIRLLNKDSSKFDSTTGNFIFNTSNEQQIIDIEIIADIDIKFFYIEDNTNKISDTLKDYDFWISNGEFYSYYFGGKDRHDRQVYSAVKMSSRSYLSPSLYHIYRTIYNALTVKRIKTFDGLGQTYKLEKLKKLCYILATSPLIDKVNTNILQNDFVYSQVYTYVDRPCKTSVNDEIKELLNIVAFIFKYYKQETDFTQKQVLANNYITTKTDLFKHLANKYGCYLKVSDNTKIKYKKPISNGSHGYINCDAKSCFDKNIDHTRTTIYNDIKIELGHMYAETQMNPDISSSGCLLKLASTLTDPKNQTPIYVPLSNMAISRIPDKLLTTFNKDIALELENVNEINTFIDKVDISQNELFDKLVDLQDNISYSWSLVSGPECLRFSDYAGQGNFWTFPRNSSDSDPRIYIRQTGLYTIQGITSFGSTLKCIENIRIYVHNSSNEYSPEKQVPALLNYSHPQSSIDSVKEYRVLCPNLRSVAFHKAGLVWIVDSDMYVCDVSNQGFDKNKRLVDYRFSLHRKDPDYAFVEDDTDKYLYIEYKPNNTVIKLYKIKIENMRSETDIYGQCKSFYDPKILKTRKRNINVVTGAPDFHRGNKYPNEIDLKDHIKVGQEPSTNDGIWQRNNRISFLLPKVSNGYAPNVSTYGGYSQSVVSGLGLNIPFHPVKINGATQSLKSIPNNTFWNTSQTNLTRPEEGLIASDPANLNKMSVHNYMGGSDPSIRCHLVNIPVTGYTTFYKGYFHPNSGWYSYDITDYNPAGSDAYKSKSSTNNPNISSIKKFRVARYNSYEFEGPGFYNLRSDNDEYNNPIVYSTAIELISYDNYLNNGGSRDWRDQDPNYGLRNLNGINALSSDGQEMVDDFLIIRDKEAGAEFSCNFVPTNKYVLLSQTMNNLTIEDVELKINYINIANLKNIVFALEIYNPNLDSLLSTHNNIYTDKVFQPIPNSTDRLSDPESWLANINTSLSSTNDVPLLSFLKEHKKTNTLNEANKKILYLYNQESLDNYHYHYSLNFSDNFSKINTFTDENKISVSGVGYYNQPIKNKSIISPCISPTGYSEKDAILFRQMIKNNQLNLIDGSFAKIKKLPLKDTKFTLKVYVLGPEENIQVLDNTLLNSYLSGLSSYDNRPVSNTVSNSICSWNLVLHTKKTPKFTTADYLGSIDYESNKISSIGYNYIADFTNREYLIPKVNINAPYDYIQKNICKYPENEELSKPLTYPPIVFPYVGRYTPTFFTLVGAMVDMQILRDSFAIGGRGDPIINMLYDIRAQRSQMQQNEFFYKPIYEGGYLGDSGKVLVEASKDGNNWYRMEVPIFKYENTALLSPNKFKYLKLHKDMAVPFSNFPFSKVKKLEDIIDSQSISRVIDKNISLNGLTISISKNETIDLQENDIVSAQGQTNEEENGVYYARSGAWVPYHDPGAIGSLLYNKMWGNNTLNKNNISQNKIISVIGSRAYNLFDINDNIALMSKPAATGVGSDLFTGSIANKALIRYNNVDLSVFTLTNSLPSGLSDSGFIGMSLDESDCILIYKDTTTYKDDISAGKWGLSKSNQEKNHINNQISHQHSAVISEGAIGYGSNYLQPDTYSYIETEYPNKILDTHEILNNNVNDKIKYNDITTIQYRDNSIKNISFSDTDPNNMLLKAYPYRYEEAEYSLNALNNYTLLFSSGLSTGQNDTLVFTSGVELSGIRLNKIKNALKNSLTQNHQDYYFIDLKSDKFKTEITSISGEIILENDFIKTIPIQPLSNTNRTKIQNRLTALNTKSTTPPAPNTINLNTISSIPDLELFYKSLPVDPAECFQQGLSESAKVVKCSGATAKQKLSSLYAEKNELLTLLANNKLGSTGVLPYSDIEVIENATTKALSIKYVPKSYYFIHIDPEQECTLSEDSTAKILVEAKYYCEPTLPLTQVTPECDSVCKPASVSFGTNENLQTNGSTELVYTNKNIEIEKQKYPGVVWDENNLLSTGRSFHILCEEENTIDLNVNVLEKYLVPLRTEPKQDLVKNIFNLTNNSEIFIKFRNMPRKIRMVLPAEQSFRGRDTDGADNTYFKYVYDENGRLIPTVYRQSGGRINSGLYAWQCIKVRANENDPYQNNQYGEFVDPPDVFKWMNEMIFRGYFGSVDGVENKNTDMMDTKEMWEWIPYEYFK